MHLILLSGGSGKRLWPLSNEVRSKQFLQVLPGKCDVSGQAGPLESMVQRVFRQLSEVGRWDSVTIAAGASQTDILGLQVGEKVNIIIEPERRDTFPAIALACSYLFSELGVKENEPVAVLPVDPFVDNDYFTTIHKFEQYLKDKKRGLILMGAAPTFPSMKYGYIVPEDEATSEYRKVRNFKEKPDQDTAENLLKQGALWNCGVFGFNLGYVLDILRNKYGIVDLDFKSMKESFIELKKISFDYEVVEHASDISVIQYDGKWKDLGTWETLTEEMGTTRTGFVMTDEHCLDTHIINELDIPLVAMDVSNTVIVASSDGILVAEKGKTPHLKEMIADLKIRPMYEEKRWGYYRVVEHTVYEDNSEALTKKLTIRKGMQLSYQLHHHRKEIWSVIRGEGLLILDGLKRTVLPGDVIQIAEEQKHGIQAITDLELIEVQLGQPLIEEDIERLQLQW